MKTVWKSIVALVLSVALLSTGSALGAIRYVALDGSGAGGQSWATAYPTIAQALNDASIGAGDEIWVKQGVYALSSTIRLTKAVKIYGGFSGVGSMRDYTSYVTVLDVQEEAKRAFTLYGAATIDGFTITNGHSWGIPPNDGGGIYIEDAAATVANCTFYSNSSDYYGGALATVRGNGTTITNCVFTENDCVEYGGAIYNYDSDLTITNCTFTDNIASATIDDVDADDLIPGGGAIYNEYGESIISDCILTGNGGYYGGGITNYFADVYIHGCTITDCHSSVNSGGGMYNYGSSARIAECLFSGNDVDSCGGGVFDNSTSTYVNCIFWDNSASWLGGGMYVERSALDTLARPVLTNCTFSGNSAGKGGGMYTDNAIATLTNSILWGNSAWSDTDGPGIFDATNAWQGAGTVATYCDIQGTSTFSGEGNIRLDPSFANSSAGNFKLLFGSPCMDTGSNEAPSLPAIDFDGKDRVRDGDGDSVAVVDMGALEYRGRYVADYLLEARIYQTDEYDSPADAVSTETFTLELETTAEVSYVQFHTPGGLTYTIFTSPSSGGNEETYYRFKDGVQLWGYRGVVGPTNPIVNYGNGTYTVTLHFATADSMQANLWYGVPNSSSSLVMPSQKPNITSPDDEGTAISPVTLTWDACTDFYANHVSVEVADADEDVVAADLVNVGQTSSNELMLDEGYYTVEVAFENSFSVTTSDAIPFKYGKTVSVKSEFEVVLNTVYRFWSPIFLGHFYTISMSERDHVRATWPTAWTDEGPAYHAYATPYVSGVMPVYRYWSPTLASHFYTIDQDEMDFIEENYTEDVWVREGIAFYAFPPDGWVPADAKPVYRFWNEVDFGHFYTTSEAEKDYVLATWPRFVYEGIVFYAFE